MKIERSGAAASAAPLVIRDKRDVYEFVNSMARETGKSKFIVFIALASVFVDSWDIAGFGAGVPSVTRTFGLHPAQVGILTAALGVGSMISAVFGGALVDRLGRVRMFLLDMLLFVIAAIVGAFAPNVTVLIIARFLMGIGIGIDIPAALSMVAEHSSAANKRGNVNQNLLWQYIANIAGFTLSWALVSFTGIGNNLWRWQVGLGGGIALAILLTRLLMAEESAFWLASRNQLKAAAEVLTQTYGVRVELDIERLRAEKVHASYIDIFRGRYLARTILSSGINLLQSIVYFAVGFYLPVIMNGLFKNFSAALLGTIGLNIAGLLGSALSVRMAGTVGLRRETAIGFGLEVPLLIFLAIGLISGWMPPLGGLAILSLFIIAHTFGPGQTGISIAALSFPTELRGRGTGFSYGFGRLGAVIGFYVFPVMLGALGLGRTLFFLAGAPLLGTILALAIRWDPTGAEADLDDPKVRLGDT